MRVAQFRVANVLPMLKHAISHSSVNMKLFRSCVDASLRVQSLKSPEQMEMSA